MVKISRGLMIGLGMIAVFSGIIAVVLVTGGENLILGNVSTLQLTENFSDFNCDAWNELAVVRGTQVSVVGSGREGFNPSFESAFQTASLLTLTDGSANVDGLQVRLVLNCDGNFVQNPTTVSGSMSFQLCGDPTAGGTICFVGDDRTFEQLQGTAVSTTTFFDVPIESQAIPDDVPKVIWKGDISAFELERLFNTGDGTIHFKSIMLPVLDWQVNHPTLGIIPISYNAITANDPIISQYGQLRVIDIDADTDGDGIPDSQDGCINQRENFDGYMDEDGCPDEFVSTATTCSEAVVGVDDMASRAICIAECEALGGEFTSIIGTVSSAGGQQFINGQCSGVPEQQETIEMILDELLEPIMEPLVNETEVVTPEPEIIEPTEEIGEFIEPTIPPPIFEPPPPPPVQRPDVPVTTTTPIPDTTEDEERNLFILLLLVAGIIAIIIAGIVNRVRKK